jgi:hypothetical protein
MLLRDIPRGMTVEREIYVEYTPVWITEEETFGSLREGHPDNPDGPATLLYGDGPEQFDDDVRVMDVIDSSQLGSVVFGEPPYDKTLMKRYVGD